MDTLYYVYATADGKKDAIVDAKTVTGDFNEERPDDDFLFLNKTASMDEAKRILASYRQKLAARDLMESLMAAEPDGSGAIPVYAKAIEAIKKQIIVHRIVDDRRATDTCPTCGDPLSEEEKRYCSNCGQRVEFRA